MSRNRRAFPFLFSRFLSLLGYADPVACSHEAPTQRNLWKRDGAWIPVETESGCPCPGSPASRRCQDKRGRDRSAAIPPNELSLGKMWWQHVPMHLKQAMAKRREMWTFCENPVCPDPVWKPVTGDFHPSEKSLLGLSSEISRFRTSRIGRATPFSYFLLRMLDTFINVSWYIYKSSKIGFILLKPFFKSIVVFR